MSCALKRLKIHSNEIINLGMSRVKIVPCKSSLILFLTLMPWFSAPSSHDAQQVYQVVGAAAATADSQHHLHRGLNARKIQPETVVGV